MWRDRGSMIDGRLASRSGATAREIPTTFAWHGRLMVLAWSVLAPVPTPLAIL